LPNTRTCSDLGAVPTRWRARTKLHATTCASRFRSERHTILHPRRRSRRMACAYAGTPRPTTLAAACPFPSALPHQRSPPPRNVRNKRFRYRLNFHSNSKTISTLGTRHRSFMFCRRTLVAHPQHVARIQRSGTVLRQSREPGSSLPNAETTMWLGPGKAALSVPVSFKPLPW